MFLLLIYLSNFYFPIFDKNRPLTGFALLGKMSFIFHKGQTSQLFFFQLIIYKKDNLQQKKLLRNVFEKSSNCCFIKEERHGTGTALNSSVNQVIGPTIEMWNIDISAGYQYQQ